MLRKAIYNIPLFRKTISKIPMRISLPLLFTAPVVGVVIVLSAIAFLEGQSAANDLMEQNLAQIQDRIEERLDDLLNLPNRIQQVNTNLIREGWLDLQNLRSWRKTLFEQAFGNYPVIASAAADRQIAAAAKRLEEEFGSNETIAGRYQLKIEINGNPYLLMISPSEHETGLTWIIATLVPESDFLADIKAGRYRHIRIGGLAVFITLLFGAVVAAISIWPMMDLVAFVHRIDQGDLEQELKLEYSTEFVQLSKQMNAMTAGLRDRMRLRNSLALAQEVQQNLLPSGNPEINGFDIIGHATYCDETGGDYFDFLTIAGRPDTTAAIAVGDVVGHGVAAAMLMATARGILRSRCRTPGTLADLLTHLNSLLVEDTGGDRFMTMLLLTVDAKRKEMRWATAGHDTPILYDPATDHFSELNGCGMSLGLVKGVAYEEYLFSDVQPGQVIMVLTDGLWEAFNRNGEMFGKDRVRNLIRRFANLSATEIGERINAELSRFLDAKSPDDDLTFVIVKVL